MLDGGTGIDTADYSNAAGAVRVSLTTPSGNTGEAQGDTLLNIEIIIGSEFNDVLVGDAADNTFMGGDLLDNIFGFAGDDTLNGDGGNDRLFGGDLSLIHI